MDKNFSTAAQARTRNAEPSLNQHANELHPLHRLWLRRKLRKLYRNLTGRVRDDFSIDNDERGREVLMVLLALGLSHYEADMIAPWALLELRAIIEAADQFNPTRQNMGKAIGLTHAEWMRWKAWAFWPCDKTDDEVEHLRKQDKNKRRREKWRETHTELMAQIATECPRDAAVLTALERIRQRPGCFVAFVPTIMRAMTKGERAAFPHNDTSYRKIVYRTVSRLEKRGRIRRYNGLIFPENLVTPSDSATFAKSLIGHEKVETDNRPAQGRRTMRESPYTISTADRRQDQTLTTKAPHHVDQHPADEGRHGQEADLRHEQTAMSDDTFTAEQRAPSKDARRLRRRVPVVLYDDGGMAMTERTKRNGSNR